MTPNLSCRRLIASDSSAFFITVLELVPNLSALFFRVSRSAEGTDLSSWGTALTPIESGRVVSQSEGLMCPHCLLLLTSHSSLLQQVSLLLPGVETAVPYFAARAAFLASSDWKPPNRSARALILFSTWSASPALVGETTGTGAFSLPCNNNMLHIEGT